MCLFLHCDTRLWKVGTISIIGSTNLGPKQWMQKQWCVNCKWVLKNWHSHLGSTSHPSQTNEAPTASKWDWYLLFWDFIHNTGVLNIERGASFHGEEPIRETPHPPLSYSLRWCKKKKMGKRRIESFHQVHQYSVIHGRILAGSRFRMLWNDWMDVLLCHSKETSEIEFLKYK